MLLLTIIFAVVHSGMASLRESGEKIVGERVYRVLFAGISLPLAVTTIVSPWCSFPKGRYTSMINKSYCALYSFHIFSGILHKSSV
jgi:hypothetical protein